MKKEELKAKLTKLIDKKGNYDAYSIDSKQRIHAVGIFEGLTAALELIDRSDEPELPAIPQFVADFIKGRTVSECFYYSYIMPNECNQETYEWINDNQTETARAILDGYTIEPEQPNTQQYNSNQSSNQNSGQYSNHDPFDKSGTPIDISDDDLPF